MSDRFRWRYGETKPVVAAVVASTVIETGDLVYLDSGTAKPASSQTNQTTKPANQTLFAGKFLGVAMQSSPAGSDTPVRIATSGVFELDCNANTFELGNYVGIETKTGGLENQKVDKTTDTSNALGRIVRREPTSTTTVLVEIVSTVMAGGVKGTTS